MSKPDAAPAVADAALEARLTIESMLVISQSISHIPSLSTSGASALAPDAEYRIRQIIQDGMKFMNHSKRTRLTTDDINAALRLRNADPVYGYSHTGRPSSAAPTMPTTPTTPATPRRARWHPSTNRARYRLPPNPHAITEVSTRLAKQSTDNDNASAMQSPSFTCVHNTPDLYFATDSEHRLVDALREPLPPLPLEVTVHAHWLAVDSCQPTISQNPVQADHADASTQARPQKRRRKNDDTDAVTNVKGVVKHVLFRELQLYFDFLRNALFRYDMHAIENAVQSVSCEHGLVQLLPYLTKFVCETTRKHLRDLPLLFSLMRLVDAMNKNTAFQLERYLHQLLPAVASCLVGKRLCAKPSMNHWALRDFSALLLKNICTRYAHCYTELVQRFCVTLESALNNLQRPMTTHYGAVVGCVALGPLVVDRLIKRLLPTFSNRVLQVLNVTKRDAHASAVGGSVRRMEAARLYAALVWAVGRSVPEGQDQGVTVTVDLQKACEFIPGADVKMAELINEFGKDRVYPLDDKVKDLQVANDILKLAHQHHLKEHAAAAEQVKDDVNKNADVKDDVIEV